VDPVMNGAHGRHYVERANAAHGTIVRARETIERLTAENERLTAENERLTAENAGYRLLARVRKAARG
jgi:hypothetical protein